MPTPMDHYAVFGHPVRHSLSPRIHRAFARQTGEHIEYRAIEPPVDGFAAALEEFLAAEGSGANVTLPFKAEAWERCDHHTARAEQAGTVNTLRVHDDGRLTGDNTDGAGLMRDLAVNRGRGLDGQRVLLLGAGGAAHGIIGPLLAAGVESLHIANRSPDRAQVLAEQFHAHALVTAGPLDPLPEGGFDLILNATSASTRGEELALPEHILGESCLAYDLAYSPDGGTDFTRWAQQHEANAADGWGMLVEQAAEAFCFWRGIRPDTAAWLAGPHRLEEIREDPSKH